MPQDGVMPQKRRPFPGVGEIFTLTNREYLSRWCVVSSFGYKSSEWGCRGGQGSEIPNDTTRNFKLVRIAHQPNFESLLDMLQLEGDVRVGCWVKVFYETFETNGQFLVCAADDSWMRSVVCLPVIQTNDELRFYSIRECIENAQAHALWLVGVDDEKRPLGPEDMVE